MNARAALAQRFRDLGLFWKLLLPLLAVLVLAAVAAAFLTMRFLTQQAQADLDHDLLRRLGIADAHVRDESLYLLEAVRFGANLEGVPEAMAAGDATRARELLSSVPAARTKLDFLLATDAAGVALVQVTRSGDRLEVSAPGARSSSPLVARVLDAVGPGEIARAGVIEAGGRPMVVVAGPVGADGGSGVMAVGVAAGDLARAAAARAGASLALFDGDHRLLARSDDASWEQPPPAEAAQAPVRRSETGAGEDTAAVYGSLDLLGDPVGTVGVRLPSESAFSAVRGTALRLLAVFAVVVAALVALGALLSRLILTQVRTLLDTNRALGRGDLSARAPVLGNDELGELARGMNLMAEQLDAGHRELERRVAERTEELEHLYAELERTSASRSQAVATIIHELRNQLFVLASYARELTDPNREPDGPNWRVERGKELHAVTQAIQDQVDGILDLARAEARGIELEVEDMLVQEALAELRPTLEALARRGDLRIEFDVPDALPAVRADRARLAQIVLNLVSNAVKYTPPEGSVVVAARAEGRRVEMSVSDTGIGIPEDVGDRLFEPFYRVAGSRPQGGLGSTGLGLAITKRLVDAHQGTIRYESRTGAGTTFTVALPVATRRRRTGVTGRRRKAGVGGNGEQGKQGGKSRNGGKKRTGSRRAGRVLRTVTAAGLAAGLVAGSAEESEARCVTVGADGVSHTQCGLP